MKALIVIEIPDGHILKTTNDLYERLKGYKCELKSMPTEISPRQIYRDQTRVLGDSRLTDDVSKEWCDGWNECLREILGDSY